MNHVGQCRLCPTHGELVKSHVFPSALVLDLGSEGDRARVITTEPGIRERVIPSGWHGRYLCDGCEKKSKLYDDYAIGFLRRPLSDAVRKHASLGAPALEWSGIDQGKLKLFALWCLWRASMCDQPEFEKVRLGSHTDSIAKMLRESDPADPEDYATLFVAYDTEPEMLLTPWNRVRRANSTNYWKCFLHRYEIRIKVDKRPSPPEHAEVLLGARQTLLTPTRSFLDSRLGETVGEMLAEHRRRGQG